MILPFIIWTFILLFTVILFRLIFRKLGCKDLGIIISSAHFVLVCVLALIVYSNLYEAQIEFIWFILMFFDLPIMPVHGIITKNILSILGDSKINTALLAPFVFYGVFGTLQYFLVGKIIDLFIKRLKVSGRDIRDDNK
jgi:hypothetical protein